MQHRIVKPAILSMIGAYSPFYIAAAYLPITAPRDGFGLQIIGIIVGAWLSAVSVLLLFDTVRHRIWGLLVATSYTIVFPAVFFFSWILTISQLGTPTSLASWLAIIAPLVGLIGGVWGFLWRSPMETVTAGSVAVEVPNPSRFPRDKPVIPVMLSLVGTALPLFILYLLVGTLLSPPQPQPPQEGSVGPDFGGLFLLFLPALVGGAAFLVLFPTIFSIFLLFDKRRHKAWGAVLTVWWGIPSAYLFAVVVVALINAGFAWPQGLPWYTAIVFSPFLGLAGGVWGFYWHTGVNPRAWTRGTIVGKMRGLSGRVTVGGLASLVCSIFASPVLAILPFFLVVGNIQFGKAGVGRRPRGLALLGLVVANGLFLLAFEVVEYLNAWWEVGPRLAGLASLAATVLAGSGLVWSIGEPLTPGITYKPEQTRPA